MTILRMITKTAENSIILFSNILDQFFHHFLNKSTHTNACSYLYTQVMSLIRTYSVIFICSLSLSSPRSCFWQGHKAMGQQQTIVILFPELKFKTENVNIQKQRFKITLILVLLCRRLSFVFIPTNTHKILKFEVEKNHYMGYLCI